MEDITTTTIALTGGNATRASLESDWRFAELIAATWVEPELSARYTETPDVVLAEFGIVLAAGETAPALPAAAELDVFVEEFDQLSEISSDVMWTYTAAPTASVASRTALPTLEATGA